MQSVLADIVFLGLFVFLFGAISFTRQDDRLRCWVAGWLCVMAHFVVELWRPASLGWQQLQSCISIDALAVAAVVFIVSTMILVEGRGAGLRLGILLALPTLLCIDLAIADLPAVWPLAGAVVLRQSIAMTLASRVRRNRPLVGSIIGSVCIVTVAWMLTSVFGGHPEVVVYALLGEMYLICAVDFWNNGWVRSAGLKTMSLGLVAWSGVFPFSYGIERLWPHFEIASELWNVPKLCVAIGMILMVLEEDSRAARVLNDDYRLLFDRHPNALWITDMENMRLLAANPVAAELHGYTREEFLKLKLTDILHPDLHERVRRELEFPEFHPHRTSRHLRKDGTVVPIDLSAFEIVFQGRRCRLVMAIDVTEREALQEQLDHQAGHDRLTGLPNRILIPDLLAKAVEQAAEGRQELAVLSVDIDRFKRVNDFYGLRVGDEYIKSFARILTSRMRSMDIVARTGGDEFTIVLTGLKSSVTAEHTVKELMEVFAQPLVIEGYKLQLPISMGVSMFPENGTEALALWSGAERARSEAKTAGGGRAIWLSQELKQAAEEQIALESYMRAHLEDGGFRLAYQPLYGMDGAVRGLEALLRLDHPEFGLVSPGKIIPIAEATGLIIPLGQWVIEETCRQLLVWKSQGMRLVPVAVNISGLQLMHVDFASRFMSTLKRYSIDPHWIHLEVTETAAMHNLGEVADQMTKLSAEGIAFSIDDFGTGHSSLGRLHQLRISELKIDRAFIDQLCVRDGAYQIVQAIVTLAHTLGHVVVAEGVETTSQLACLRELKCDLTQGFLLSRPVTPEEIPALVRAQHPAINDLPSCNCSERLRLVDRVSA